MDIFTTVIFVEWGMSRIAPILEYKYIMTMSIAKANWLINVEIL